MDFYLDVVKMYWLTLGKYHSYLKQQPYNFNAGKGFNIFCFRRNKTQLLNILANGEYTNC